VVELVLLPVKFFDMKTITATGHKAGAIVGWDLAHAAGNIN
jgi:kynureninase